MSFFDSLRSEERLAIAPYLEDVTLEAGTCILEQGTLGDECYLIDAGRVRLELHSAELDSDAVLDFLEAGQVLGEFGLFDRGLRSASAFADTAVAARRLTRASLDALCADHPRLGIALLTYLAQDFSFKLRQMDARLGTYLSEGQAPDWVDEQVASAAQAQSEWATWDDGEVDAVIAEMAREVAAEAAHLAAEEVAETGLGNSEDKAAKLIVACRELPAMLLGTQPVGTRELGDGLVEIRQGVGAVLGVIPLANALPTLLYAALCCLKARCALIASCPHTALGVGGRLGEILRGVLIRREASPDLVQWIYRRASRATTSAFMTHPGIALIVASAGPGVLRSAHSSGRPALGMGACNTPVWVAADADVANAARLIVASKSFDFGLTPGAEDNLVVDHAARGPLLAALEGEGAVILSDYDVEHFTRHTLEAETGALRADLVGQSAVEILARAGLDRGLDARLIVVPQPTEKVLGPWGDDKPAPIVSLFGADGETDAVSLCRHLLSTAGAGHTAIVHTADPQAARRFASALPVGRVLCNAGGCDGALGLGNALPYAWTLGGGTWAGTTTTDNLGPSHMVNVTRLCLT
ncbi:MAG: aldehyde dehydrogenase family protein [Armatimonadetes bacterium]|nr:aldehyde dehydrogenase family protein [Armatimonadota bacterium]